MILSVIMLMALTLLAISAIKMGAVNLRAVNNLQTRTEAMAAGNAALNTVLSSSLTQANGDPITAQTVRVAGIDVSVSKPCIRTTATIPNGDLPFVFPTFVSECQGGKALEEKAQFCRCLSASEYKANDMSASTCFRVVWDVTATVSNSWFGANVAVTRGVGTNYSSSGYYAATAKTTNFCS